MVRRWILPDWFLAFWVRATLRLLDPRLPTVATVRAFLIFHTHVATTTTTTIAKYRCFAPLYPKEEWQ